MRTPCLQIIFIKQVSRLHDSISMYDGSNLEVCVTCLCHRYAGAKPHGLERFGESTFKYQEISQTNVDFPRTVAPVKSRELTHFWQTCEERMASLNTGIKGKTYLSDCPQIYQASAVGSDAVPDFLCDVPLRKSTSKWKRKVGWPSTDCAEILWGLRRKLPEGHLPLAQSHFVRR